MSNNTVTVYSSNPIYLQRLKVYKPSFKNKIVMWFMKVFKKEKSIMVDISQLNKTIIE